uniref:Uncharacterized protein n=1 Tax=Arundo donax TaxID=35708 RepID=A0A0A9FIH8_ARUDO
MRNRIILSSRQAEIATSTREEQSGKNIPQIVHQNWTSVN